MKNLRDFFFSLIFAISPSLTLAQPGCIRVDQIEKWEILDQDKTVVYDSQGNSIAFIIFNMRYPNYLSKTNETFRFFSSTICRGDRVQTSKAMTTVFSIELIRK